MHQRKHVDGIAAGGRVSIESDAQRAGSGAPVSRDRNILPAIDSDEALAVDSIAPSWK
jgi:hypothetical protein